MYKMGLNLIIGISTLIVVTITLFITLMIWYHERKIQLNLLRSLYQHLDTIKRDAPAQYNFLISQNKIPSWTITNLDLNYYLSHINHKLKKEGFSFEFVCTRELKQQIINIVNKLNNINNLYSLMYTSISQGTRSALAVVESHKHELSLVPYYKDLDDFINKSQKELRNILKKRNYSNRSYY